MDPDTGNRLAKIEETLDKTFISVEKTRKYFQWTLWITIIVFVLPLIAAVFIVPAFISSYVGQIQTLTQ